MLSSEFHSNELHLPKNEKNNCKAVDKGLTSVLAVQHQMTVSLIFVSENYQATKFLHFIRWRSKDSAFSKFCK